MFLDKNAINKKALDAHRKKPTITKQRITIEFYASCERWDRKSAYLSTKGLTIALAIAKKNPEFFSIMDKMIENWDSMWFTKAFNEHRPNLDMICKYYKTFNGNEFQEGGIETEWR